MDWKDKRQIKEYQHQWYLKNRNKIRKRNKLYQQKHPEIHRKSDKKWRDAHKKEIRAKKHTEEERKKHSARKRDRYHKSSETRFKYKIRMLTNKIYGRANICQICGSTKKVQHHHNTKPYKINKFIDLCPKCHPSNSSV